MPTESEYLAKKQAENQARARSEARIRLQREKDSAAIQTMADKNLGTGAKAERHYGAYKKAEVDYYAPQVNAQVNTFNKSLPQPAFKTGAEWAASIPKGTSAGSAGVGSMADQLKVVGAGSGQRTPNQGTGTGNPGGLIYSKMPAGGNSPAGNRGANSAEVARIKRIQNLNGIPETGIWDAVTDKKYKEVKSVQEMLNRKHGFGLVVDGISGTETKAALLKSDMREKIEKEDAAERLQFSQDETAAAVAAADAGVSATTSGISFSPVYGSSRDKRAANRHLRRADRMGQRAATISAADVNNIGRATNLVNRANIQRQKAASLEGPANSIADNGSPLIRRNGGIFYGRI